VDTEALVVDAFSQLGLQAQLPVGAPDGAVDLVLDPDGVRVNLQLKRRALVSGDVAERLVAEADPARGALLVVADRVTDSARTALVSRSAGYLDLRGRLALRVPRLVVDSDVDPLMGRPGRSEALAGRVGLEVATALLLQPARSAAGRELAREVGRSPSTVSEILSALRRDDLIDEKNIVVGHDLFWQLAERWPAPRTYLVRRPNPGDAGPLDALRLGLGDVEHEPGWALTDSAAAAAYGAPQALRTGQSLDFFVPDELTVRRAVILLGAAQSASGAAATVRAAPVPAIVRHRIDVPANPTEWPLAQPLFVALDLAQDAGRGREILDAWTPEEPWARVW
jgi:hypothetical protein